MTPDLLPNTQNQEDREKDPPTSTASTPRRPHPRTRPYTASPRRRSLRQPLTIRMNLTERQMNRVTDAIAQKVERNPMKAKTASITRSWSPIRDHRSPNERHHIINQQCPVEVNPPTFSDPLPDAAEASINGKYLAQRRNKILPPPISTYTEARFPGINNQRLVDLAPTAACSPERQSPCKEQTNINNDSGLTSSYYRRSDGTQGASECDSAGRRVNEAIQEMYKGWTTMTTPNVRSGYPKRYQSLAQRPRMSKNTVEHPNYPASPSPISVRGCRYHDAAATSQNPNTEEALESPLLSPLPLYFRGQNFPLTKRGEKTMIGRNGWLECTGVGYDDDKRTHTKRMGFLDSIKKLAKDVTAELHPSRRPNLSGPEHSNSQVAISLDTREQSLLYCELEFHLTSALNDYITAEFRKGHLKPDNLKKISDLWLQQGRPRVISFQYDLETQLELVGLHLNEFNFYGRRQSNPSEIMGLLHAMRTNARALRVRTFCHPDSVIAKQLVDSQSLFNLVNVSNAQQLALTEIGQFFKMIVERERAIQETYSSGSYESSTNGRSEDVFR